MDIWNLARSDMQAITGGTDWGVPLTFTAPGSPGVTVIVNGLATKHHLIIDESGSAIRGTNTHCSVSEQLLLLAGYPVRNNANEVAMAGHLVTWTDVSGVAKTYKIKAQMPDEMLGLIVFELTNYR